MKLTTLLLGLGILVGAAGWAVWEHRAARAVRAATVQSTSEAEELRTTLRLAQDKINEGHRELKAMDEQVAGLERLMATLEQPKREREVLSLGEAAWQTNVPYVDLPKSALKSIRAIVLNVDDEITPDATALFGLTTAERDSVRDLYKELTARFEQLERDHLTRTNQHNPRASEWAGDKISFAILPFPAEADALRAQWPEKLERLVGTTRAELIAIAEGVRNPNLLLTMRRGRLSGKDQLRLMTRGQNWLSPHPRTDHITFIMGDGNSIRGLFSGGSGGGTGEIPERWRHLITEEMLRAR